VDERNFVSGIRELPAILTDLCKRQHKERK